MDITATLDDVVARLNENGHAIPAGSDWARLNLVREIYETLSHSQRCASRHPFGECTCVRSEIADVLDQWDRAV